jgi:RNA polymerase sigma factor (sigma-70 family)
MAREQLLAILRSLHRFAATGEVGGLTDADLVERFAAGGDEAAFEVLVWRHGPAVLNICHRVLGRSHDAEDAFQATFLVLVRKARSIRRRQAVAAWLYRVAHRVALQAKVRARRRAARERPAVGAMAAPAADEVANRDLRAVLEDEVHRLPAKYRLPVLLCYLGGQSTEQAAQALGCPRGTILSRLAWARQRLRGRLTRRGLTLSTGAVTALLARSAAPAAALHGLVNSTLKVAKWFAARSVGAGGVPPEPVLSLTEGVLRSMFLNKVKVAALVLVVIVLAGAGGSLWFHPAVGDSVHRDGPQGGSIAGQVGAGKEPAKAAIPDGRRREAVIRLPAGTWVKEFEAPQYGSGRITWKYEDDRVTGLIEGSGMGGEFELATEAEISLSRHGTVYGVLTSVKLNRLKLPEMEELADLKPFVGLWPAVEPLLSEVMTDLPFSYQCRVSGDRLVINTFRMLLCGPNPLGKVGALIVGGNKELAPLGFFQALAIVEGSYTAADGKEKEPLPGSSTLTKPRTRKK